MPLVEAFAVLVAFNLSTAVPSPANAGSFEAGGTLALVALGVEKSTAWAFLLLYHAAVVAPTVVAGTAFLMARGLDVRALFGRRRTTRSSLASPCEKRYLTRGRR